MEPVDAKNKDKQRSQTDSDPLLPSWGGVQTFVDGDKENVRQWLQRNYWLPISRNWQDTAKRGWKTTSMALSSIFKHKR
jgi:hypothetical protein